jgi:hypothetical protein
MARRGFGISRERRCWIKKPIEPFVDGQEIPQRPGRTKSEDMMPDLRGQVRWVRHMGMDSRIILG